MVSIRALQALACVLALVLALTLAPQPTALAQSSSSRELTLPVAARQVQEQKAPKPVRAVQSPQRAAAKIQPMRRAGYSGGVVRAAPTALSDVDEIDTLSHLRKSERQALARGTPGSYLPPSTANQSLTRKELPYMARIENTSDIHQHVRWDQLLPEVLTGLGYCTEAIKGPCWPMEEDDDPDDDEEPQAARLMPLNMCGPSAMANQIVYLGATKFPQLTIDNNLEVAGYKAALEIGVNKSGNLYYGAGGYGFADLIYRTEVYLEQRDVRPTRVRIIAAIDRRADVMNRDSPYSEPVPTTFQVRPPTLADVKAALKKGSIVNTLWGFYVPTGDNAFDDVEGGAPKSTQLSSKPDWFNYWDRDGGHWVAAVGYGKTKAGDEDPSVIVYHNSGGGNRKNRVQEHVSYETVMDYPTNPVLTRRVDTPGKADTALCPELGGKLVFCRAAANGMLVAGPPPAPKDKKITLMDGVIIMEFD